MNHQQPVCSISLMCDSVKYANIIYNPPVSQSFLLRRHALCFVRVQAAEHCCRFLLPEISSFSFYQCSLWRCEHNRFFFSSVFSFFFKNQFVCWLQVSCDRLTLFSKSFTESRIGTWVPVCSQDCRDFVFIRYKTHIYLMIAVILKKYLFFMSQIIWEQNIKCLHPPGLLPQVKYVVMIS